MPPKLHFQVVLPKNRNRKGKLSIFLENKFNTPRKKMGQFEVLGRGSKGNSDTQFLVNGNTPTGGYQINQLIDTMPWLSQGNYGKNGALRLKPISGNAILAKQIIGRKGLLIHGGRLKQNGNLMPTYGCLRVHDSTIVKIKQIIKQVFDQHSQCYQMNITVQIIEQ